MKNINSNGKREFTTTITNIDMIELSKLCKEIILDVTTKQLHVGMKIYDDCNKLLAEFEDLYVYIAKDDNILHENKLINDTRHIEIIPKNSISICLFYKYIGFIEGVKKLNNVEKVITKTTISKLQIN